MSDHPQPLPLCFVHQAHGRIMHAIWHKIPEQYGDITPEEAEALWRGFQANPNTQDLATRMMRRRCSILWQEYLSTN